MDNAPRKSAAANRSMISAVLATLCLAVIVLVVTQTRYLYPGGDSDFLTIFVRVVSGLGGLLALSGLIYGVIALKRQSGVGKAWLSILLMVIVAGVFAWMTFQHIIL